MPSTELLIMPILMFLLNREIYTKQEAQRPMALIRLLIMQVKCSCPMGHANQMFSKLAQNCQS